MRTAPRTYRITRDGVTVAKTLTGADALHYLHSHQPHSVGHALRWEGWDVIDPDGVSWAAQERGQA